MLHRNLKRTTVSRRDRPKFIISTATATAIVVMKGTAKNSPPAANVDERKDDPFRRIASDTYLKGATSALRKQNGVYRRLDVSESQIVRYLVTFLSFENANVRRGACIYVERAMRELVATWEADRDGSRERFDTVHDGADPKANYRADVSDAIAGVANACPFRYVGPEELAVNAVVKLFEVHEVLSTSRGDALIAEMKECAESMAVA